MSMDTNDTVGIENSEFTGRAIAAEYVDHATGKRSIGSNSRPCSPPGARGGSGTHRTTG